MSKNVIQGYTLIKGHKIVTLNAATETENIVEIETTEGEVVSYTIRREASDGLLYYFPTGNSTVVYPLGTREVRTEYHQGGYSDRVDAFYIFRYIGHQWEIKNPAELEKTTKAYRQLPHSLQKGVESYDNSYGYRRSGGLRTQVSFALGEILIEGYVEYYLGLKIETPELLRVCEIL